MNANKYSDPHEEALEAVRKAGWTHETTAKRLTAAREASKAPGSYEMMLRHMPNNMHPQVKAVVRLYVDVYTLTCSR